ncbi:hypothetical protein Zmor_023859 [Zophobas morio]|uniref:Uncharacterized protein n=1 Tax=Zophobas morio TaxID=2755281 RepID=A0AA38M6U3_9CUCU|nr:hypothetical protein Zmor_023859 [Zophobas morio]
MVVQHLRNHGTFNPKLTIVVVMGRKGLVFAACSASYIQRTRSHPYHVDKMHGLEPADCPRCVTHFLSDGTPHNRQQVRFQETVFEKRVLVG